MSVAMEGWIIGLIIVVLLILIVCLVIYKLMVIVHQAEGMVIERLGRFHKVRSVWEVCRQVCGRSVGEVHSGDIVQGLDVDAPAYKYATLLSYVHGSCFPRVVRHSKRGRKTLV